MYGGGIYCETERKKETERCGTRNETISVGRENARATERRVPTAKTFLGGGRRKQRGLLLGFLEGGKVVLQGGGKERGEGKLTRGSCLG